MKSVKVTEFVGEASGDCECFCFDKLTEAEREALYEYMHSLDAWPEGFDPDKDRIYPHDLLPDVERGKRGRWRITVEFEPEERR